MTHPVDDQARDLARKMLPLLRDRESALAGELTHLTNRLRETRNQLQSLYATIRGLTAIAGLETTEEEQTNGVDEDEDNLPRVLEVQDSSQAQRADHVQIQVGKRIPTPRIVSEIVEAAGRPVTREEIRSAFEQRGLAANYENPTNVVGTAIMRAKKRGWIEEDNDGLFQAPASAGAGTPSLEQVVR